MKKLWVLLLVSFLWTVSCSPKPDIKKLTQQANQGNAKAQFNLGWMYYFGRGVPQDDVQAMKWFILAAAQGYVNVAKNRDRVAERMGAQQLTQAEELARNWKSKKRIKDEGLN